MTPHATQLLQWLLYTRQVNFTVTVEELRRVWRQIKADKYVNESTK